MNKDYAYVWYACLYNASVPTVNKIEMSRFASMQNTVGKLVRCRC